MKTINGHIISLIKKYNDAVSNMNSILLRMSGMALTLLVSLQSFYIPQNPKHLWLLQLAWGGFGVSLLSGLLFFFGELHRMQMEKRDFEEAMNDMPENTLLKDVKGIRPVSSGSSIGLAVAVLWFVVAITSLVLFSILNLYRYPILWLT